MDKKIAGVIGAITGLAALDQAAQATPAATPPQDLMNARSFADLLDPIPNAVAALRAADAAAAQERQGPAVGGLTGEVQVAGMHHHHHHHHHRVIRRIIRHILPHHHHHHHHHHHNHY